MKIGADVVAIEPDGVSSGRLQVNAGTNAVVTDWSWDPDWNVVTLVAQSDYYYLLGFDLDYISPTNGTCVGYYYNYGWWTMGAGTFTDQDLN